jgi:protein gp37
MSGKTSIEWTDKTWNPTRGCSRVSEGCRNCYAERVAARFSKNIDDIPGPQIGQTSGPFHGFAEMTKSGPRWTGRVELVPAMLEAPLRWRKPARIFVNSMSDLFHESLSWGDIALVLDVIVAAKQHTFQVLTKRPERMRHFFGEIGAAEGLTPPSNLWLGVSCEDQKTADERIPLLLETPAAVRFVSYEPALGPVDFKRWVTGTTNYHVCADVAGMLRNRSFRGLADNDGRPMAPAAAKAELERLLANGVKLIPSGGCNDFNPEKGCRGHRNPRLDQLIIGGESGPGARPFDVAWMRSVVAQCREAGVAAFCKQWGSRPFDGYLSARELVEGGKGRPRPADQPLSEEAAAEILGAIDRVPRLIHLDDSKGGDISEWGPGDWPREFPVTA